MMRLLHGTSQGLIRGAKPVSSMVLEDIVPFWKTLRKSGPTNGYHNQRRFSSQPPEMLAQRNKSKVLGHHRWELVKSAGSYHLSILTASAAKFLVVD